MHFSIEPDERVPLTLAFSHREREKVPAALSPAADARVKPANDILKKPSWPDLIRWVFLSLSLSWDRCKIPLM
jgi:hypothetical protein